MQEESFGDEYWTPIERDLTTWSYDACIHEVIAYKLLMSISISITARQ